jgi:hypothetical protein
VGEWVGVVLPVRVTRVGGLHELVRGRAPVDDNRIHRQVRAVHRIDARTLEVEAEVGQALSRAHRQYDVVARQKLVARRVIDHVDVGVQARVSTVSGLRIHVITEVRQGMRT